MIDVIANAKGALDVLGHTGTGPEVGREPGGLCALEQMLLQPLALPRRKPGRSARSGNRFQCRPAAQVHIVLPAPYTARLNPDGARYFGLRQPLTQQVDGPLPLALQFFRTAKGSDRSPPNHHSSIGH